MIGAHQVPILPIELAYLCKHWLRWHDRMPLGKKASQPGLSNKAYPADKVNQRFPRTGTVVEKSRKAWGSLAQKKKHNPAKHRPADGAMLSLLREVRVWQSIGSLGL
jgi:hypothetical protein